MPRVPLRIAIARQTFRLGVCLLLGALLAGADVPAADATSVGGVARRNDPRSVWAWPLAAPHPVLRGYTAPASAWGAGHRGIDLGAPVGAEVLAPADGIVHFAGSVVDRPVLSIEHDGGLVSTLEPVASPLRAGDPVHRGEVVGVLVAGHCASPCLHLGARRNGAYLSPLLFLGGAPHAVLLPLARH